MRSVDSNTLAALNKASLDIRTFLYVRGKDLLGDPATFGFWSGEDDVNVTVVSALDGSSEARTYLGSVNLDLDPLPFKIGLESTQVQVRLSQIATSVQTMVRGNDIRQAVFEVHRGYLDVETGQLVAAPNPRFLGKINSASIPTAIAGEEGAIILRGVSNTDDLTRSSTALKSDETQKKRSGDRFRQYAGVAGQWPVWWGELQDS